MRVFVSHAGRDRAWAEWIAWQLGHLPDVEVELDCWDWQTGDDFVAKMADALDGADAMIAVCSQAYFEKDRWTREEWLAAFRTAKERPRFLLPVRIDDTPAPALLAGLIATSLHGQPAEAARRALIEAVRPPGRPDRAPDFPPAVSGPRLPGVLPAVWGEVPPRNEAFTGRDGMLVRLREGLTGSGRSIVQALHGAGGVGKTQLAGEYVWRFAGDYDAVWWVHAEQRDLIAEQYAAFAAALDLVDPSAQVGPAVAALQRHCRTRDRWLVVLDNATTAADIRPWLLPGPGHVLVTSRDSADWPQIAAGVPVDVFARLESVALLHTHLPALPDADAIAEALGDLPLAVAQAAGVLGEGVRPADYLTLLKRSATEILAEGRPLSYPAPLAAAVTVALDQLTTTEPAAIQLLRLCAVLAPDPIPTRWFAGAAPELLGEPLAAATRAPLAYRRILRAINRYGLAKLDADRDELVVHRLTQAIIRDHTPAPDRATITAAVSTLLARLAPDDTDNPMTWPVWAELLSHLRSLDLTGTDDHAVAWAAGRAAGYLLRRGDTRAGHGLARQIHVNWSRRLGPDHRYTRWAATYLTMALHALGDHPEARQLDQQLYDGYRTERSDDDPSTLVAANNLASSLSALGSYQQARELCEDTLARRRRILGDDHPDTLVSANNLAHVLRALGEHPQARELNEDTLARRRRILGDDHPNTLNSANNLAADLRVLGDHRQARVLDEDTLARRRRVLGDDHLDTLRSARNLAADLRALGDDQQAEHWKAWARRDEP